MSNFPKRVYISSNDLFDDHTAKPNRTFARNMYVMVNPWDGFTWDNNPEYIRGDVCEELQSQLKEARNIFLQLNTLNHHKIDEEMWRWKDWLEQSEEE